MEIVVPIINWLGGLLGLTSGELAVVLGAIVAVANIVGRLIPDDATGVLGVIRRIAKIIGLYVPNKVSPGLDTANISKASAASNPEVTVIAKNG